MLHEQLFFVNKYVDQLSYYNRICNYTGHTNGLIPSNCDSHGSAGTISGNCAPPNYRNRMHDLI